MLLTLFLVLQAAEPTIVVEGQLKTDAEIRQEAQSFVKAVAAAPGAADQFARWNEAICPKTIGATDAENALTIERIRQVATEAGIKLSKRKDCAPNILIAFTHEPSNVVRQFFAKRPHAGRALPVSARSDLVEGAYPVRWWYDLKVEGRYGEKPIGDHPAMLGALQTVGAQGIGSSGQIAQSENQSGNVADFNSSLIGSKSRQSVGAATVIIDVNRVRGQSKDALASYVAMIALAPLRLPPRPVPTPTITNLFYAESEMRADELTEWDRAYIVALYKTAANRTSKVQSGLMTAKIARSMRGEDN